MKRYFLAFTVVATMSLSSFALPTESGVLIKALMSNKDFKGMLKANAFPFDAMSIEVVERGSDDWNQCQSHEKDSRSSTVLKVSFVVPQCGGFKAVRDFYFVTSESVQDLQFCTLMYPR